MKTFEVAHPPHIHLIQPTVDDVGWEVPTGTIQELADRQSRYCICIPVLNEGERTASSCEP